MKWLLKLVYAVNIVLALISLLAYVSPFVNPSLTWFFSFFAIGFPILLIAHIVFMVFWLVNKPKYLLLSFLTLALGFFPLQRTIGFNNNKPDNQGVNIMSYNIGHSKYFFDEDPDGRAEEFKSFIGKYNPAVVCLQERTRRHLELYDKIFDSYYLIPDDYIGTCIYSRLPVINNGNIYFDTNAHNATWADLVQGKDTFRVYSIHLSSNKVVRPGDDIKEIWERSLFILDKYNFHALKRTEQIKTILEHSSQSPYPVLLTGDFNDVPQSYLYRKVCQQYDDAFLQYGKGFGKTHKTTLPILRIDYSFHSSDLPVSDFRVVKSDYSDHYPLITKLNFKNS